VVGHAIAHDPRTDHDDPRLRGQLIHHENPNISERRVQGGTLSLE
jgi:hypothetical protein